MFRSWSWYFREALTLAVLAGCLLLLIEWVGK